MRRLSIAGLVLGGVVTFGGVAPARAQTATVSVRVMDSAGRPIDGTVTLRGPATATCRTVGGRCQLRVPPGTWTVTLTPTREVAPAPRQLQLRAGTTTALSLRTTAAPPQQTVQVRTQTSVAARPRTSTPPPAQTAPVVRPQPAPAVAPAVARAARSPATARPVTEVNQRATTANLQPAPTRPPATRATPAPSVMASERPTVAARASSGRDLTRGRRLSAQATILDAQGRPTDATLTVRQGGRLVGTARTVAGRASLYDLAPGTYDITATFARSRRTQRRTVTIGSAAPRLTFRDR